MSTMKEPDCRPCVDATWARPWITPGQHPKHMIEQARAEVTAESDALTAKVKRQGGEQTDADMEQRLEIAGKLQLLDDAAAGRSGGGAGTPGGFFPTNGRTGPDLAGVPRNGLANQLLQSIGDGDFTKLHAALDGTVGGSVVQPFFEPDIMPLPQRALFLRSLIPTTVVPSPSDQVAYVRQTVATDNAAAVAAGSAKPTSVYTFERDTQKFTVIAHLSEPVDVNFFSDFASLSTWLEMEMRLGVLLSEESEILSGNGTFPHLPGVLNTAGLQTQAVGADNRMSAVHKAVTKVRLQNREPNGVAFHPTDWESIRLYQATTGEYIAADPLSGDPNVLWGMKVVTSSLLSQGTAVVGYWDDSHLWVREDARIDFRDVGLDQNGHDMFQYNEMRWRCEERIAFAVLRPSSFCTVTGL